MHSRPKIRLLRDCAVATIVVCLAVGGGAASGTESSSSDRDRLNAQTREFALRLEAEGPRVPSGRQENASAGTDGINFTDISAQEIDLEAPLAGVPSYDMFTTTLATSDGQVCVLGIEGLALRSLYSSNGGQTFGSEVDAAGAAGQPAVLGYAAALASEGSTYAAVWVADPLGDRRLQWVLSTDRCQTWSTPADLVTSGDPSHGVTQAAIATGSSGVAGIAFIGRGGTAAYATVTTNGGTTWTNPVRLDPASAGNEVPRTDIDIAIDEANDNVYVTWNQELLSGGASIYHTVSTDGGQTFAAEQDLDAETPDRTTSRLPSVGILHSNDVLIAFRDGDVDGTNNALVAVRSTNFGASYSNVFRHCCGSENEDAAPPTIVRAQANNRVLLGYEFDRRPATARSTNNGGAFSVGTGPNRIMANESAVFLEADDSADWYLGWTDVENDSYLGSLSDVFVRKSTDGGATWPSGTEQQVDSDPGGAHGSRLEGLAHTGGGDLLAVYSEGRDDNDRSENVYANRAPLGSFGTDYRIDSDPGVSNARSLSSMAIASDGADHVYAAFSAVTTGPYLDMHVAASSDGGYTFATPVRVGDVPAGGALSFTPTLEATSDGHVYLVYTSQPDDSSGLREVRFNRSTDFGQTWQSADVILDTFPQEPSSGVFIGTPAVELVARNGGTVYIAWSDGDAVDVVKMRRSFDGGATLEPEQTFDVNGSGLNRHPALCANGAGTDLVLAIQSLNNAATDWSVWGATSADSGATFGTFTQLRTEQPGRGWFPVIACNGSGTANVFWPDNRNGSFRIFSARYDGSWTTDIEVGGPLSPDQFWPRPAYVNATTVVVVHNSIAGLDVQSSRSVDNGTTFATIRLDSSAPDPDAASRFPEVAVDASSSTLAAGENVWVAWIDSSAGDTSIVARHSSDGGASFGPVRRIDSEDPQGALSNSYFQVDRHVASLPGAGFFVYGGARDSRFLAPFVNVWDVDDADRDGFGAASDCDNSSPQVWAVPAEVGGVAVAKDQPNVRVSWTSQDATAGDSTVYDVVTGSLDDLRGSGTYAGASCLVDDQPDTPYDDTRSPPSAGQGEYYLVRAQNSCGTATYGDSSETPDPRDGLDSGSPCP